MSAETARKMVDFFLNREVSGDSIELGLTFFGGEPFLAVERIEQIVAWAREPRPGPTKRVSFYATTNATLVSQPVERVIRDAHMGLLISLDGGPDASLSRPFVSGRSSHDIVVQNLPRLVSWAASAAVRMTFHPQSLRLLENVRYAFELGAPAIALCPVVEADWTGLETALDEAYDALADWYLAEACHGRYPALVVTEGLLRQWHAHSRGAARPSRPCGVATSLLGINTDGSVMPCHRFLYRSQDWLGTVDSPHLSDARSVYTTLSSSRIAVCDGCAARPVCGGGCRLVALDGGYGLDGAHPGYCLTMRAHARAARRIYHTLMAEQAPEFSRFLLGERSLHPALTEYR